MSRHHTVGVVSDSISNLWYRIQRKPVRLQIWYVRKAMFDGNASYKKLLTQAQGFLRKSYEDEKKVYEAIRDVKAAIAREGRTRWNMEKAKKLYAELQDRIDYVADDLAQVRMVQDERRLFMKYHAKLLAKLVAERRREFGR